MKAEDAGMGRAVLSEGVFDEVAREIQGILRRTGLERTLAIGALVIERFFGGSIALWREHRNHKNNSVRRLALRADCPLSRSSLNQAVAIYAAVQSTPSILELRRLDASHIGVVLPLTGPDQEHWLREANDAQWSVRQLREAIQGIRRRNGERRGRPKATDAQRTLSTSRALLDRFSTSFASLEHMELDGASRRALDALRQQLAALLDDVTRLSDVVPSKGTRRDSEVRFRYAEAAEIDVDGEPEGGARVAS